MELHEATAFLAAAGLGGFAQALIAGEGVVRIPYRDSAARRFDLGFISDIVIGLVAATAALIIGLAFLNALVPSPAESVATSIKSGVFAQFPRWVHLASFGALVGFGGRRLLPALSQRVVDAIEHQVERRTDEMGKKVIAAAGASAEPVQEQIQALRKEIHVAAPTAAGPQTVVAAGIDAIDDLVRFYDAIDEKDYIQRVRKKNEAYQLIIAVCGSRELNPEELLSRLADRKTDAYALAVAAFASARPEQGVGTYVVRAGQGAKRLHVKYHLAAVLALLASTHRLTSAEMMAASGLLDEFLKGADTSLQRRIEATRSLFATLGS